MTNLQRDVFCIIDLLKMYAAVGYWLVYVEILLAHLNIRKSLVIVKRYLFDNYYFIRFYCRLQLYIPTKTIQDV